jgi:hypothetical protein
MAPHNNKKLLVDKHKKTIVYLCSYNLIYSKHLTLSLTLLLNYSKIPERRRPRLMLHSVSFDYLRDPPGSSPMTVVLTVLHGRRSVVSRAFKVGPTSISSIPDMIFRFLRTSFCSTGDQLL